MAKNSLLTVLLGMQIVPMTQFGDMAVADPMDRLGGLKPSLGARVCHTGAPK